MKLVNGTKKIALEMIDREMSLLFKLGFFHQNRFLESIETKPNNKLF